MDHIDKILDYYTEMGIEKRLGSFIDQVGLRYSDKMF